MSEEGTHEVMIIYDDGGRSRSEEMKSSPTRWRWNFVTFWRDERMRGFENPGNPGKT